MTLRPPLRSSPAVISNPSDSGPDLSMNVTFYCHRKPPLPVLGGRGRFWNVLTSRKQALPLELREPPNAFLFPPAQPAAVRSAPGQRGGSGRPTPQAGPPGALPGCMASGAGTAPPGRPNGAGPGGQFCPPPPPPPWKAVRAPGCWCSAGGWGRSTPPGPGWRGGVRAPSARVRAAAGRGAHFLAQGTVLWARLGSTSPRSFPCGKSP